MAKDKQEVGAAYKALIGYNPFEDDANITVEEVVDTLIEYLKERFG